MQYPYSMRNTRYSCSLGDGEPSFSNTSLPLAAYPCLLRYAIAVYLLLRVFLSTLNFKPLLPICLIFKTFNVSSRFPDKLQYNLGVQVFFRLELHLFPRRQGDGYPSFLLPVNLDVPDVVVIYLPVYRVMILAVTPIVAIRASSPPVSYILFVSLAILHLKGQFSQDVSLGEIWSHPCKTSVL